MSALFKRSSSPLCMENWSFSIIWVSRKTNIYISIKVDSVLPFSRLGRALLCRSAQAFVPLKFKYALGRRSTPAIVPLFICILIWRSKEDWDECGELIQSSHSHKPFGRCNVTSWPQGGAWWRCCSINAQLQMSLPGFKHEVKRIFFPVTCWW